MDQVDYETGCPHLYRPSADEVLDVEEFLCANLGYGARGSDGHHPHLWKAG
jgi:hypothetical protein